MTDVNRFSSLDSFSRSRVCLSEKVYFSPTLRFARQKKNLSYRAVFVVTLLQRFFGHRNASKEQESL